MHSTGTKSILDSAVVGSNYDKRILEHLIQTIEISALIQKCLSMSRTLLEFLMKIF